MSKAITDVSYRMITRCTRVVEGLDPEQEKTAAAFIIVFVNERRC